MAKAEVKALNAEAVVLDTKGDVRNLSEGDSVGINELILSQSDDSSIVLNFVNDIVLEGKGAFLLDRSVVEDESFEDETRLDLQTIQDILALPEANHEDIMLDMVKENELIFGENDTADTPLSDDNSLWTNSEVVRDFFSPEIEHIHVEDTIVTL